MGLKTGPRLLLRLGQFPALVSAILPKTKPHWSLRSWKVLSGQRNMHSLACISWFDIWHVWADTMSTASGLL